MDQHKELEVDVEGEPTDQRKEPEAEAEAGKPEEPADQRKEEEEEREEGDNLKEPTDQRKEGEKEAEDKSEELTDQRKAEAVAVAVVLAEVGKTEELTDQRKAEAVVEVDKFEELTDQRKEEAVEEKDKETERSSGEESMEASSVFVHPCSLLLRYLVRAYAWCMGMADWFGGGGGTRPSAAPAASLNSSRGEREEAADIGTREISNSKTTGRGFYMRVWAVRRPRPPGNPREGRGGGGGSHN